jgi:cytosine/adenosine deaminase-related metal-dependent hydrolase
VSGNLGIHEISLFVGKGLVLSFTVGACMILRAKYVMPNSRTIIENGAVATQGSQIVDVGRYLAIQNSGTAPIYDLGEAVLMPGLVNAHTHLDLTSIADSIQRVPKFTDWIFQIVGKRTPETVGPSVREGVQQSLAGGVTTVGDIDGTGESVQVLRDTPIRKVVFFEVLGFSGERAAMGFNRLATYLDSPPVSDSLLTPALSPHAPYSTSADIYRECVMSNLPVCTHIAETKEELEFLSRGTGAFLDYLEAFGISTAEWSPPQLTPVQYMGTLGILRRSTVLAHCNYLTDADVTMLAESGVSVVFCPRSHHYFYHTDHPVAQLIEKGINVAIGTDSLASNWSLSLLDELKFLARTQPYIRPETLLDMVTCNGAKVLGLAQVGRLEKGWQADIIAVQIPNDGRPVIEQILDESSENLLTVVGGKICYASNHQE